MMLHAAAAFVRVKGLNVSFPDSIGIDHVVNDVMR
jgi:hypothetical protein